MAEYKKLIVLTTKDRPTTAAQRIAIQHVEQGIIGTELEGARVLILCGGMQMKVYPDDPEECIVGADALRDHGFEGLAAFLTDIANSQPEPKQNLSMLNSGISSTIAITPQFDP